MYTVSKKVELHWKLNPTPFKLANKEYVDLFPERLSANTNVINQMVANQEEFKSIMTYIPDVSATGVPTVQEIRSFFNDKDLFVVPGGTPLEVGFIYNLEDAKFEKAIRELEATINKSKTKKAGEEPFRFETSEELGKYVEGFDKQGKPNVPEESKYKYGRPIEAKDYCWWRYALKHPEVAKHAHDMPKSGNIKFYLSDEESKKAKRKANVLKTKEAMSTYLKVSESQELIDNIIDILYVGNDYKTLDNKDDKMVVINDLYNSNTDKFVSVANDAKLNKKALIERMIRWNIIKRLSGDSSVIVDANDSTRLIGNDIDEAILFIDNPANKAQADEYKHKLKAVTSIKQSKNN